MTVRAQRIEPRSERASGTLPSPGRPGSAVVILEHETELAVVVLTLQHEGWQVRGFVHIAPALASICSALPDVVLADLGPGEGATLARELRIDPRTRDLALVGTGAPERPDRTHAALFDEILSDPIDVGVLGGTLALAIARRRP